MDKKDLTCPPLDQIWDEPENGTITVCWLENRSRWFRVIKYEDLDSWTLESIMKRNKNS